MGASEVTLTGRAISGRRARRSSCFIREGGDMRGCLCLLACEGRGAIFQLEKGSYESWDSDLFGP